TSQSPFKRRLSCQPSGSGIVRKRSVNGPCARTTQGAEMNALAATTDALRRRNARRDPYRAVVLMPDSDVLVEPAVDLDRRAGHIAVALGHEERGDIADLLGLRPAAEQRLACDAGADLVRRRASHLRHRFGPRPPRLGVREPGADVVHGDA